MAAQDVELVRKLRSRTQAARIAVTGDEAQCLLLALARDHDRRMGPGQALRHVQRPFQPVMLADERPLVAMFAAPEP